MTQWWCGIGRQAYRGLCAAPVHPSWTGLLWPRCPAPLDHIYCRLLGSGITQWEETAEAGVVSALAKQRHGHSTHKDTHKTIGNYPHAHTCTINAHTPTLHNPHLLYYFIPRGHTATKAWVTDVKGPRGGEGVGGEEGTWRTELGDKGNLKMLGQCHMHCWVSTGRPLRRNYLSPTSVGSLVSIWCEGTRYDFISLCASIRLVHFKTKKRLKSDKRRWLVQVFDMVIWNNFTATVTLR